MEPTDITVESQSLDAIIKKLATDFFFWWYNQSGANTYQGFDEWWKKHAGENKEQLQSFTDRICREQREICAERYNDLHVKGIVQKKTLGANEFNSTILHAPATEITKTK